MEIKILPYNLGWRGDIDEGIFHFYPINDSKDHLDVCCPCKPSRSFGQYDVPIVIHDSFDGREMSEESNEHDFGHKVISKLHH